MDKGRDHLRNVAQLAQNADGTMAERFWQRGPFIWTIITALFLGGVSVGCWTGVISYRVSQIEKLSDDYTKQNYPDKIRGNFEYIGLLKNDRQVGIIEEVHQHRREIRKLKGLPDDE